jgi:hypothetical protein
VSDVIANGDTENLTNIGSRISADQQDALSLIRQSYRSGTCQRGLADAAFAGKE